MTEPQKPYGEALSELEERKRLLAKRLQGLEAALSGIRAQVTSSDRPAFKSGISDRAPFPAAPFPAAPFPAAPFPERETRRKPAGLNIYVNRDPEWAARQFVPPSSPRSVFRKKTGHRCPKCGSRDTRFSLSRGFADIFMFFFDYASCRCRNCDTRFRKSRLTSAAQ